MLKSHIYIGGDHAGLELKNKIITYLKSKKYKVRDFGPNYYNPDDDYPDFIIPAAKAVARDKRSLGIAVCGTGDGACIASNKIKGVRAVQAWSYETARSSRLHNNANMLCLPGGQTIDKKTRGVSFTFAQLTRIIDTWLTTPFSKEERHIRRLKKIARYEA